MKIGHGNDIYLQGHDVKVDFSSNVIPGNMHNDLHEFIGQNIGIAEQYPDPCAQKLSQQLAKHHHVSPQYACVTNGATEAFYLIAQHFATKKSTIFTPSFSEYEDACKMHGHQVRFSTFGDANLPSTDLIWLGNPNNPTGKITRTDEIEQLLQAYPHTTLIVDEAYGDLCTEFTSVINLVEKYANLMVVRSLTKAFVIPGLRLGYVIAQAEITERLSNLQIPWSVNALAQNVGSYLFDHYERLRPNITSLLSETQRLKQALQKIKGITVFDSSCNFLLLKLASGSALALKTHLMEKVGFLIRDASNFRGLTHQHVRIAAQHPEQNDALLAAIQGYMEGKV